MSSSNRILKPLLLALRAIFGVVFIYAAWAKLKEPWELFALGIMSYQLPLPMGFVQLVARTLPWLELLLGVMLLIGLWGRTVSVVTSLLVLGFFGMVVRAYAKDMDISCGCFGPGGKIDAWSLTWHGALAAGGLFLASLVFLSSSRKSA